MSLSFRLGGGAIHSKDRQTQSSAVAIFRKRSSLGLESSLHEFVLRITKDAKMVVLMFVFLSVMINE